MASICRLTSRADVAPLRQVVEVEDVAELVGVIVEAEVIVF